MNENASSPSFCRPQHLDRERLRVVLSAEEYADVRYHEAVVFAGGGYKKAYKILAIGRSCLYIFPLTSFGAPIRLLFSSFLSVERVSPKQRKKQDMILNDVSELFLILYQHPKVKENEKSTRAPQEYFVSTFEPETRVFFYTCQSFQTHFQTLVLCAPDGNLKEVELVSLLESFVQELIASKDRPHQSSLLGELAIACTSNLNLKRLFFQHQISIRIKKRKEIVSYNGLAAYLLGELSLKPSDEVEPVEYLEYHLAILQLFHRVLFDGHTLAERLGFLCKCPITFDQLIALWTKAYSRKEIAALRVEYQLHRADEIQVLLEDITDIQTGVILELHALKLEAALFEFVYPTKNKSVCDLLCAKEQFAYWFKKLFKRIAVSFSRTSIEVSRFETTQPNSTGTLWSLILWRNVTLLDMLMSYKTTLTMQLIAKNHLDHLNFYLRNADHLNKLAHSSVCHVLETARKLETILEMCKAEGF